MRLFDAHCHIDMLNNIEIESIRSSDGIFITNGTSINSNIVNLNIADYKHIFPAAGIDPQNAALDNPILEDFLKVIDKLKDRIVAIGEIGIDLFIRNIANRSRQEYVFREFLKKAEELRKPVIIHSRSAIDLVIDIISSYNLDKIVFHYFEGSVDNIKLMRFIENSESFVSVPPLDSKKRREVILKLGIDKLLTESDAPAVAPSPFEVSKSIRLIAETLNIKVDDASEAVYRNGFSVYKIEDYINTK
ncbi:MAG: Tat-linked quality control protein TatD [Candidatus Micrarchaeota archaeon]|nr:MAG: Tat-linked quality control protein TatD [Candidatus Micrarchaeota archaeon]